MSTFKVTVEKLVIEPHENADALELAQVGLYRAVVPKGVYKTGGWAVYIPEQAVLPPDLIEELGLTGRLAGKDKNRVKAVRLRGALSQGIVCRPKTLDWMDDGHRALAHENAVDLAVDLGITKWVPEIPTHMSGAVIPAPDLIRWPDIENLKRYPNIFTPGEPVVATEKIHGTCCLITWHDDKLWVSSKGFGEKNLALEENDTNLYWRAAKEFGLHDKLRRFGNDIGASAVAIFGEVYGQGVQDLTYGKAANRNETLGYVAFDVKVSIPTLGEWWLNPEEFELLTERLGVPAAPVLYEGPFDIDKLTAVASGPTVLGNGSNIREGIVIRPAVEAHSDVTGGRKIAKLVSDAYLLRKNATEFE